jgi:hypothetical protein
LSWVRRGTRQTYTAPDAVTSGNYSTASVDEFWAYSAAPLTADNITWTYGAGTLSFSLGVAFGVPGVSSTLAPFDTNVSLPGINSNVNPGFSQTQVTLSTDNAADLIFASCTSQTGGGLCSTTGLDGWTQIAGGGFTSINGNLQTHLYYKRVTSLQSATVEDVGGSANSSVHDWLAIGDAFAGGAGTGCNVRPQVWIAQ